MSKIKIILLIVILGFALSANSQNVSFPTDSINGHGYVDLGLSVMWATCNVGASNFWEYGDYYGWAETATRNSYHMRYGYIYAQRMGDISGDPQYDVATVMWGNSWWMPRIEEIKELIDKCERELITINGHIGYKITGPNGNSIFLPFSGYCSGTSTLFLDKEGLYWSSTPCNDNHMALTLFVSNSEFKERMNNRYEGMSVRPITKGNISSQDVKPISGTINGYEWVDLGLSVKWATCNIGASSSSDYGEYFSWGEIEAKSKGVLENSKLFKKKIGCISGNSQYDAATANWGESWRLPTIDEMSELKSKCKWTWTTVNGHKGYKIIGPNRNSIFLPATGWCNFDSVNHANFSGRYWSATPDETFTRYANCLDLSIDGYKMYNSSRDDRYTCRPVTK